jgi:hypothetical protein
VLDRGIAACAEFPNDNPALHEGAIWTCAGVTAPVTCETRAGEAPTMQDVAEVPAVVAEPPTEPTPPVCAVDDEPPPEAALVEDEGEGEGEDIEIVAELPLEDVLYESVPPADATPPTTDDPYVALVRVLEQVALDAGASEAAVVTLRAVLGQLRIEPGAPADHQRMRAEALAWQGILRGESEDFAACGVSMLDEWSALLVATLLGAPGRADTLKRELRRKGVAAFGLVDLAA